MPGDTLVNIKADTVEDFLDRSHKAMSDAKKLGETTYDLQLVNLKVDSRTKTITKGSFTLKTETRRVHWAGQIKTKPDDDTLEAITKIEKMNADHEKRHRETYQDAFDRARGDLEQELVGKTMKEAKDILEEMHQKLKAACEELHKSEGFLQVTKSGAKFTIKERGEGSGGCV